VSSLTVADIRELLGAAVTTPDPMVVTTPATVVKTPICPRTGFILFVSHAGNRPVTIPLW
jgi:hypothetical protein